MKFLARSPTRHLYKVCFEEKWQGRFEDLADALNWGREVGDTGRLVHVAVSDLFTTRLVAVYPQTRRDEGEFLWKVRARGAGGL